MRQHARTVRRLAAAAGAVAAALLLSACQQGFQTASAVQAPGVPVAFDTLEGAPEPVLSKVTAEVNSQASARRIEIVSSEEQPRYRLKGYLTAYPSEDGETTLAFVWDVFDSSKKRAQRVSTTTVAKGQSSDPWSQIGETQIAKAASDSMNEVASFLAAGQNQGGTTAVAGASPRALGFSAVEP